MGSARGQRSGSLARIPVSAIAPRGEQYVGRRGARTVTTPPWRARPAQDCPGASTDRDDSAAACLIRPQPRPPIPA
jgi:hypothetical protein